MKYHLPQPTQPFLSLNLKDLIIMKRNTLFHRALLAVVFVFLFFAAIQFANATNVPPPKTPDPVPTQQTFNVDIDAAAKASAAAKAAAQSSSNSAALGLGGAGGAGGVGGTSDASAQGGAADSYSASGDVLNQHSSRVLVFPAPVWTQVPQATGCFVTESHAGSLGWNFASGSKSIQFSDPICVSMRMAEAARLMCHFQTAELIDQNTFKTLFPNAQGLPTTPGIRNLSLAECEEAKRPRLVMTAALPAPIVAPAPIAPTPVVAAPVPAPKPPVKRAAPRKAKPAPCDEVLVERKICIPRK